MYHDDHDTSSTQLPLVAGITETAQSDPGLQLSELLSGMLPRPTRDRISSTIDELEAIARAESDDDTKTRVGCAIAMLRGGSDPNRPAD